MSPKKSEPKDISSVVLWTAGRQDFRDGQKGVELRVVDWIVGGKHYPQLEKREMFVGTEGDWKMGKAKGMSLKDLLFVQDKWGEIMAALGQKGTIPNQTNQPAQPEPSAPVAAAEVDF